MKDFTYSYPTHVYFGKGALANALKDELPAVAKKVLLAYGGGSIKKNGIYQEVTGLLQTLGKEVVEFTGIMANPTYAKVQEGAQIAKEKAVDYILAVGGGSVIDCCKIVAAQAKTDKDLWEMEFVDHQFPQEALPMGAVVTASGTGAEMNGGAVITNEAVTVKAGMGAAAPRFAQVVFGKETAEEGIDALSAFIQECGLPTKMGQLQSKVEITPDLLRQVADSCNLIKTGPRQLTRDEVYTILCQCL